MRVHTRKSANRYNTYSQPCTTKIATVRLRPVSGMPSPSFRYGSAVRNPFGPNIHKSYPIRLPNETTSSLLSPQVAISRSKKMPVINEETLYSFKADRIAGT
jgi:hypothetical protein